MPNAASTQATRERVVNPCPRVAFYDTLRGFTIVSMCAFHACYDLAYLYGMDMPWFTDPIIQDLWRDSISFTFLILAGWMTSYSRSNLKRAAVYALAAAVVWAATTIAAVDTPVNFGILYCMAACTLVWGVIERTAGKCIARLSNSALAIVSIAMIVMFALTYRIPLTRYPVEGLAWLGFPSASFASGDYYPLLPYLFLYLLGVFGAMQFRRTRPSEPVWMLRDWCPPLTVIGRHSLLIYLLHQPAVLLALSLVLG